MKIPELLSPAGWNWKNVLPYFIRAECVKNGGAQRGGEGCYGLIACHRAHIN